MRLPTHLRNRGMEKPLLRKTFIWWSYTNGRKMFYESLACWVLYNSIIILKSNRRLVSCDLWRLHGRNECRVISWKGPSFIFQSINALHSGRSWLGQFSINWWVSWDTWVGNEVESYLKHVNQQRSSRLSGGHASFTYKWDNIAHVYLFFDFPNVRTIFVNNWLQRTHHICAMECHNMINVLEEIRTL